MISLFTFLASSALIQPFQEKSFLNWMRTNNKFYTGDEYHLRFGIYLANSQYIEQQNKLDKSYKLSLNKFATYTPAEYKSLLGEKNSLSKSKAVKKVSSKNWPTPPTDLDWREKGAVNSVVDQAQCGSCWAFGSIVGAEGCWFLNSAELLKFSEQNLVDCVTICDGCGGGLRDQAYNYVIRNQNGQFMLESDYPYQAIEGTCQFDASKGVGGIKGWVKPESANEDELLKYVAHYGPTTVGIDASSYDFSAYTSGVYTNADDCFPSMINHGVACVGYGHVNELIKYWIIRNSWGDDWGEEGYIRMVRGKNICGVASRAYSVYFDNE